MHANLLWPAVPCARRAAPLLCPAAANLHELRAYRYLP
jgi:hypothetical protein